VLIIVGREVAMTAWRYLVSRQGISVPARRLGKWKATVEFALIALVLFPPARNLQNLWHAALWVAVVLSIVSAVDLVLAARQPVGPDAHAPVTPSGPREM
jgi:phosphatidylglycerophosphate synthase